MTIEDPKQALRVLMRAARLAIPAHDHQRRSIELANAVIALPQWHTARTVMLFVGVKAEPDTRPLRDAAHHAGKRVVLPRVVGRDIVALPDAGMLEVSNFGVPEPAFPSPESSAVSPDEIDLVIVPGLAFDADNFRVGYGGGFYDRFLPKLRADAVTIGVGFVEQLVEAVPRQAHDVALHRVVTA